MFQATLGGGLGTSVSTFASAATAAATAMHMLDDLLGVFKHKQRILKAVGEL
jgi:hypothetical protein